MNIKSITKSFILSVTLGLYTQAQTNKPPANWFNLDPQTDNVLGISTEKAYTDLLKNKKSKTVIVAVIDSGVDILHEDLNEKIWINEKEIPNNGIDDDKNGYIDDTSGWDFIGGKDGRDVNDDTMELTRELAIFSKMFAGKTEKQIKKDEKEDYEYYLELKDEYEAEVEKTKKNLMQYTQIRESIQIAKEVLGKKGGVTDFSEEGLKLLKPTTDDVKTARDMMLYYFENGITESIIEEGYQELSAQVNYGFNLDFDPRNIVGDNYNILYEKGYGNNEVTGPHALHGTHVAGIIAANRGNDKGTKGICNDCKVMVIRCVPNGDERDKDVANAILYAVDNGAKVINMSFGKSYSPYKEAVDEAVKYAEKKDVLIVHAAGNDGKFLDENENYPTALYDDETHAKNWIEVGASSWKKGLEAVAEFSNYSESLVDVFAPGVDIRSTTPQNEYRNEDGTSMASPVVAGLAGLIWSYYPDFSASLVKKIILDSVTKQGNMEVTKPGTTDKVEFRTLCRTNGVVNAYNAIRMAETLAK